MPAGRPRAQHSTVQLSSGITLEYGITGPADDVTNLSHTTKLAICLHPWSWLGGRMDDPVLQLLAEPLLHARYTVLRYNSRGVGKSTGRASFTGGGEADDLNKLVQWACAAAPQLSSLVIVGYSYGSLIASLESPISGVIRTSHLLLSYPLGPRSWLTAFRGGRYDAALRSLVSNAGSNTLVVYGDQDDFTSVTAYDTWSNTLRQANEDARRESGEQSASPELKIVKVAGASHFWREDGVDDQLLQVVQRWLP